MLSKDYLHSLALISEKLFMTLILNGQCGSQQHLRMSVGSDI